MAIFFEIFDCFGPFLSFYLFWTFGHCSHSVEISGFFYCSDFTWTQFRSNLEAPKCPFFPMAELISRKIWVIEKLCNFHTVLFGRFWEIFHHFWAILTYLAICWPIHMSIVLTIVWWFVTNFGPFLTIFS